MIKLDLDKEPWSNCQNIFVRLHIPRILQLHVIHYNSFKDKRSLSPSQKKALAESVYPSLFVNEAPFMDLFHASHIYKHATNYIIQ